MRKFTPAGDTYPVQLADVYRPKNKLQFLLIQEIVVLPSIQSIKTEIPLNHRESCTKKANSILLFNEIKRNLVSQKKSVCC